jgi:hypothetical protein
MRGSSNSAPTRARVAAFALRARGTEGAAGARADRRGTLDRAALKGPFNVRCMSYVMASLILHMCCMSSAVASAVGKRGRGQVRERQHHNDLEPLHEPRLLVDRVLAADRRQRGRLDLAHVDAHVDLVGILCASTRRSPVCASMAYGASCKML